MSIDMDKITSLLERVTSGNAGVIDLEYDHVMKNCTITWKRPINMVNYESCQIKLEMLRYVGKLLVNAGVVVDISLESTLGAYTPEGDLDKVA